MNAESTKRFFQETFGAEPDVIGSAPGRVNLIGEHTDYNGGQVLPIAIARRTYVALRAKPGAARSIVVSASEKTRGEFDAQSVERSGNWWDYMTGVFAQLQSAAARIPQVEAVVSSDLPPGSGLSSSAALEMATAIGLAKLVGYERTLKDLALLSWRAETEFVGVSCGVMDQFASALCEQGRALHIWCNTLQTEQVRMNEAVLIFDTNVPRSLRGSSFNERQRECAEALRLLQEIDPRLESLAWATPAQVLAAGLPRPLEKRALHVTQENLRVGKLVAALKKTGVVTGDLLYDSHKSLRELYECSTPELDWFVDQASRVTGVRGARLTGAGWGGCAIAVGDRDALESAQSKLTADYAAKFGLQARTWLTNAEAGARVHASDE
jgi:galactokinase